jgi:rubredoxin
MTTDDLRHAPAGTIFVCPACGRTGKDRYEMGDTSCTTWAVLCFENREPGKPWQAVPAENALAADTG